MLQAKALLLGLALGTALGAGGSPLMTHAAWAAPAPIHSRVVLGLKDPVTPGMITELKRIFKGRILNLTPTGAYAIVLLRPGETLAQVQARSRNIAWVEPEVPMGFAKETRGDVVLIPAPRAPMGRTR